MTIIEALLLGILQGLTEFIPVSSSGHLVVAQAWLGLQPSLEFDMLVNLGTFLALVVYFWPRLWGILVRIFKEHDFRLARNLILSALPVGLIGFFFSDFFAQSFIQHPLTVAFMLASVGLLMILVDKLPHASKLEGSEQLSPWRSLAIGAAQVVSLIPGTSRSGSTMLAGRLAGLTFKDAAEYSFLLSIPVMGGVLLKGLLGHEGRAWIGANFDAFLVSNIAAFLSGLLAVSFMLRYLARGNFRNFGVYRLALAVVILATLLFS